MTKKYTRKCPKCGEIIFHSSIDSRAHCKNDICRVCSDKNKNRANFGKKNGKWKGVGDLPSEYFHQIQHNAQRRNRECSITIDDAWNQFLKQNKKCALSGIELQTPKRSRSGWTGTASLDRIDSSKGYIIGNIQWVHKDVNWMKQDFEQSHFIEMCNLVSQNTNEIVTPIDIFIKENKVL